MIKKNFLTLITLLLTAVSFSQCPPTGGIHPAEGTFGTNEWIAYVYNTATYSNSSFNLTDYRGYYTDAGYGTSGINFDSSLYWNTGSNPSTATTFQGTCTVTNELHIVRYMREGFPCGKYQIDLAGQNGSAGHDDAVKVFIDGVQVYANTGCCSARINIWTGFLGPNSQIEMIWAENGGQSYGRMRMIPQANPLQTSPNITVCPSESYELTVSGSDNYDWSTNTTYVSGATNTSTLSLDIPVDAPNGTQVYTVETTEATTGCVFSKDITVTISDSANPVISATPSSITYNCYLDASPTNVIFSGAVSYTVSPMTGVTLNNVSGSNVTFNPTSTTIYTVTGSSSCGSTDLEFTVTITPQQGDPTVFGDNEWILYGYRTGNFETYAGFYTINSLNFNTQNQWNQNNSPSAAAGYLGCSIPDDYHSYKIKRQGFDCGFYQIGIPAHDDDVQLIINGNLVFSQNGWYNNINRPNVWKGYLDADSTIEMTIREQGGQSLAALEFTRLDGVNSKVWTGKVNTNFNNTGNWCGNALPAATDDVFVPGNAANNMIVNVNAQVKNLTTSAGKAVIIGNGIIFTVDGNLNNKGFLSGSQGKLVLSGSAIQTATGIGFILNELEINNTNGFTLDLDAFEVITINSVLKVTNGTFTTDNSVYLPCDFDIKAAQIDQIGGSIVGNITVEQCYPARRAYRFITSSVNTSTSIRQNWQENATLWNDNPVAGYGTHITGGGPSLIDGANGFDKSPSGAASLFTFDNTAQTWNGIANTNNTNLTAGTAYRLLLRGSRDVNLQSNAATASNTILRATGSVSKGPITFSNLSNVADGYSFIGNPFHAQVDMQAPIAAATNLSNFISVWDPTLGTRGAYVNINVATEVSSNGNSEANRFLQPYQAVFVQTIADGLASITFNEADKAVNQTQTNIFRANLTETENAFISVLLFTETALANNEKSNDGLRIDFSENENNVVDLNDAIKANNPDENIAVLKENQRLSIESRAFPSIDEVIDLHFSNYKTTNYVMQLEANNLVQFNTFLFDQFTNEMILLAPNQINNYSFTIDNSNEASKNPERFEIIFENIPLSNEIVERTNFSVFPNPTTDRLFINTNGSFESASVQLFNTIGQKVYDNNLSFNNNNQIELNNLDLQNGLYILKLKTNSGEVFESKIIIE